MITLADFLLARIAEDEEVARGEREWMRERYPGETDNEEIGLQPDKDGWVNISDGRVLAECEVKRRLIENEDPLWTHDEGSMEAVLCLLALPYADHPDYRQEWKP